MKLIWLVMLTGLLLVSCREDSLTERIIGTWSGRQVNVNGEKHPATWQFLEGGTMVVKIIDLDISYEATWSIEGDRLSLFTLLEPDPTYFGVEFASDDAMKLTEVESGIEETLTKVDE